MKIFKLNTILRISSIAGILLTIIILFFYIKFFQIRSYESWKNNAKLYVELKNKELNTLIFKNSADLENNPDINYQSLTAVLSPAINDKDNAFSDFMIINLDKEIIYQYSKSQFLDKKIYSSEQLLYTIKKIPDSVEIQDLFIDTHDHQVYIVRTPYINNIAIHRYSFVYIFDFTRELNKVLPVLSIFLIVFLIVMIIYLIFLFIRSYIVQYLARIEDYIEGFIENNQAENSKLFFLYPFKSLEQKIARLIAKQIEIEDRLCNLSEKFHLLLSQTSDGIFMEDSEGYIYFCNSKLARILGFNSEADIIGLKMTDLLSDLHSKRVYEQEKGFLNLSKSIRYKLNFQNHDKVKKECLINACSIYDAKLDLKSFYYAVTDLSDLELFSVDQTTHILSKSSYFENSSYPIVILDKDLKVYDLNNTAKNIFSINYNNAKDKSVHEFFKTYDFGKLLNQFDFNSNFKLDTFEPRLNRWFYISNEVIVSNDEIFNYLIFIDISSFRKDESFHNMIFDDLKGFIFVTNYENEVIYVSPSFLYMTQYPASWFVNYYKSMNDMINKYESNQVDQFVITTTKGSFNFKLIPLKSLSKSNRIFLCLNLNP
ncbi:MAG: PAS domain-containing protein [Candidatus Cloacimonetes bacterium]|nr:PAS domain-containing protein [Candidatus Cloacimonadota bacterium]